MLPKKVARWIVCFDRFAFVAACSNRFHLELGCLHSYFRDMKWISSLLVSGVLLLAPALQAQDAATEERLNKLAGQVEDIKAMQEALKTNIESLRKEIERLRAQMDDKPAVNYATADDLKRVADAVREVDRKRLEDYEKIGTQLRSLGKTLAASAPAATKKPPVSASVGNARSERAPVEEKGFEHIVKSGETLSLIMQAYRDQNIKVSLEQILKANPGLKPEKLRVGQKVFIPAPAQ